MNNGDKVTCVIDDGEKLIEGETYTIKRIGDLNRQFKTLVELEEIDGQYFPQRFALSPITPEKP